MEIKIGRVKLVMRKAYTRSKDGNYHFPILYVAWNSRAVGVTVLGIYMAVGLELK